MNVRPKFSPDSRRSITLFPNMSSVLPAEVNAQLGQLLQQLQSPDNNVRSQAEEVLQNQWVSQRPEWLLMGLAEQIATSTDISVMLSNTNFGNIGGARRTDSRLIYIVAIVRSGHLPPDSI